MFRDRHARAGGRNKGNMKIIKLNVTLRQLRAFSLVNHLGSFGKAAEALSMTQGALSHLVQELERQIGFKLFDRTTRRLALTPEGRTYLTHAEQVLIEVHRLHDAADDLVQRKNKQFRLGATGALIASRMPAWLLEFSRLHPDVRIDLKDVNPDVLPVQMAEGTVDLGIGPIRHRMPPAVACQYLFSSPIMLVVAQHHPFARRRAVTWEDVSRQTLVLSHRSSLEQLHADTGRDFSRMPVIELSQLHSILSVVESGDGVTIFAEYALKYLRIHKVVAIPVVEPEVMIRVGLYTNRGVTLSEAARSFHDFIATNHRLYGEG
ncbi:LysR substrate-binding domain protein [Bordetella bronchiseptica MBORD632]|nr:LysR substrate-binding domain protein [Bordetella bronchiseptica MBORD632]